MVVVVDIDWFVLYGDQFIDDGLFVVGQCFGQWGEVGFQCGIVVLCGQGLGLVQCDVEVVVMVVDVIQFV